MSAGTVLREGENYIVQRDNTTRLSIGPYEMLIYLLPDNTLEARVYLNGDEVEWLIVEGDEDELLDAEED